MLYYNLFIFLIINLFISLSNQDYAAPVYTPVINTQDENIKNHQLIDQLDMKAKNGGNDNLQTADIVVPATVVDPSVNNKTTTLSSPKKSNQNNKRKNKNQHKQYRPLNIKNSLDHNSMNYDLLKSNNQLDVNTLVQLLARQQQQQDLSEKYNNPILSTINPSSTNDLPIQLMPIYTTESSVNGLLNNNNNLFNNIFNNNNDAIQYLRRLSTLQNKQLESRLLDSKQEKPKITKRVFNSNSISNQPTNLQSSSNLQLINQMLQNQQQQQPMYTLIQPQQTAASSQPFYLALQPSFQIQSSSSTSKNSQQPQQVNSLIETGDKIIAKIKQWSTDVFNPKSSLNRQISEVINNAALATVVGGLLTLGISSLMIPLSQLNKKLDRKSVFVNKKTIKSEEKKDKNDEKTAKSDQTHQTTSQKNTKSLDKRSRLVSLMERANDEFSHLRNLVEIARNFEEIFKKYNIQERECKYRVLCEIGSTNQLSNETVFDNDQNKEGTNNNMIKRRNDIYKRKKRQIKSNNNDNLSNRILLKNDQISSSTNKTIECENKLNCTKLNDNDKLTTINSNNNIYTYKEPNLSQTNFLQNQFKLIERNLLNGNNRGSNLFRNLIRNFNLDKFINENKESFINFITTIDYLMNRAQKSNLFNYLLNDEQSFRNDNKYLKTIFERSKQLQDKLKDFLDNLTIFQQVVTKESKNLESSKSKFNNKMFNFYNLRSKRTVDNLNLTNQSKNIQTNELDDDDDDDNNVDVSGLRFILNDLINQLKIEQQHDNLLLPLSKIFLHPYQLAWSYGVTHNQMQCKSRYLKCSHNYLGLNNNEFKRKADLEILSNSHFRKPLKPLNHKS